MQEIDYSLLPEHMQDGARLYIEQGIEPGSFFTAVLANDLMESFGRADYINSAKMRDICSWIYNEAPSACHGSYETVKNWIKFKQEQSAQAKEATNHEQD